VVKNWAINNLFTSYMLMTKREFVTTVFFLVWFKFDMALDIMYVTRTPLYYDWFKPLLITSIILPYIYMAINACLEERSYAGKLVDFVMNSFNQNHHIRHLNRFDKNYTKVCEDILLIFAENSIQYIL
jgi:hypothetical protein